jgi:hypothetical protein
VSFFTKKNNKEFGNGNLSAQSKWLVIENNGVTRIRTCYVTAPSYFLAREEALKKIRNLNHKYTNYYPNPIVVD